MEELDQEGQRLLQCIRSSDGFSGRNCISGSADFQSLVPKVRNVQLSNKDLPAYRTKRWFFIYAKVNTGWPQTRIVAFIIDYLYFLLQTKLNLDMRNAVAHLDTNVSMHDALYGILTAILQVFFHAYIIRAHIIHEQ